MVIEGSPWPGLTERTTACAGPVRTGAAMRDTRSVGDIYWSARLRRWGRVVDSRPGYTLLIPVPGDLPVFLELALTVCALQESDNRVQAIVVADQMNPEIQRIADRHRRRWTGTLDIAPLPIPERWVLPRMKNPSRNHFFQLMTGVRAATGSHVILHDADLFPLSGRLFETQYEACRSRRLACLGISPVWDPWFAQKGLRLAATWEICAETAWVRSFPPYLHIGHDAELLGERHTFDTTLYPQSVTPPDRIDFQTPEGAFIHFGYVVSTYRLFQHHGPGFLDDQFRLLFISLLCSSFGQTGPPAGLPDPSALADGLVRSETAPVRFPVGSKAQERFAAFRAQLDGVLDGAWLAGSDLSLVRSALGRFDEHYHYSADRGQRGPEAMPDDVADLPDSAT